MITRCLLTFSVLTVFPYLSLYVLALGGTPVTIGFVNSIGLLASLVLCPVGAYISDYSGRVKVVVFSMCWFGFSNLFFVFARSWTTLAIGAFFRNLFWLHASVTATIIADSVSPGQRGIGFATARAIPGVLGILAPYIGGYLIDSYGVNSIRSLYFFTFTCYVTMAIIRFKFLKETLKESGSTIPLRNLPLLLKTSYEGLWEVLKWMPKSLKSLTFIAALSTFFNSIAAAFWIVYGTDVIKLTVYQWGLITLVASGFRIAIAIPAGRLVDKLGQRKPIVASLALSIIPVFSFVYCKTFLQTLSIFLLISLVNALLVPACSAFVADIVPKERRGRIMSAFGERMLYVSGVTGVGGGGMMGFVISIPAMVGSFIGGYVYSISPTYPWYLLSAALFSCMILGIMLVREPEKPKH